MQIGALHFEAAGFQERHAVLAFGLRAESEPSRR